MAQTADTARLGSRMETLHCSVEVRESASGPMLHGVLIQEGRAASVRPEVFAPGSLVWASDGVAIRAKHLGVEDSRAIPTREANGEIRIAARKRGPGCRVQRRAQVPLNRVSCTPRNPKRGGCAGNSTGLPSGRGPCRRARVRLKYGPRSGVAVKFWPWSRPEVRSSRPIKSSLRSLRVQAG